MDNKKEILEIWENLIKGNPNTELNWKNSPNSFYKWSRKKYKEGYQLVQKNDKIDSWQLWNLEYKLVKKESQPKKENKPKRKRRSKKEMEAFRLKNTKNQEMSKKYPKTKGDE